MTVQLIRSTLWSLYYRRKATIQRMREGGRSMRTECQALEALRIQLQVSEHWSLRQHMAMVVGLRTQLACLIKVSFRKDQSFRAKVWDLIHQCQSIQNQPTLFS